MAYGASMLAKTQGVLKHQSRDEDARLNVVVFTTIAVIRNGRRTCFFRGRGDIAETHSGRPTRRLTGPPDRLANGFLRCCTLAGPVWLTGATFKSLHPACS